MTHFEKIKAQIAAASVEDYALSLIVSPPRFRCADCEVYATEGGTCDFKCFKHCINWLNSPAPEE